MRAPLDPAVAGPRVAGGRPVRVALVGGGVSVEVLAPLLAEATGRPLDLRLAARDADRLAVVARHCARLVADRPSVTVSAAPTVGAALEGADVVVLMLRVGGLEARVADEAMARDLGLPGDEGLGPGGWANGLRTMPVVDDLAGEILRRAPGAVVLDLVAPLGLTTRVLADRGVPVVGVCELPGVTASRLHRALADDPVELAYAGYNHLGWFWPTSGEPSEVLRRIVAAGLADAQVVDRFGAVPLKYYYWLFDPPAAERLGIARPPGRSSDLRDLRDRALGEMRDDPGTRSSSASSRPTPWFGDAVVPIVRALLGGPPWSGWADLPNRGIEPRLPADHVVEVAVEVDDRGIEVRPCTAPVPAPVQSFLEQVGHSEELLHRAWAEGAPHLLEEAIRVGPHPLTAEQVAATARAVRGAAGWDPARRVTTERVPV